MAARSFALAGLIVLTGCVELFDELPESARIRPEAGTDGAVPDADVVDGSRVDDRGPAPDDSPPDDGIPIDEGMPPDEGMAPIDEGIPPIDRGPIPDGCAPTVELCNGLDDDCDGLTDEAGGGARLTQSCYTGPADTERRGVCRPGLATCVDGMFGPCAGEVVPLDEICALGDDCALCNDLDDDCDGAVDEGLVTACGPDASIGQCRQGTATCAAGRWSECAGDVGPSDEICDGLDNDCDFSIDEDAGDCQCVGDDERDCYAGDPDTIGVGRCRGGFQQCADGMFGPCVGQVIPSVETCDDVDEDCDGRIDEDIGGTPCSAGRGACLRAGVFECRVGEGVVCNAVEGESRDESCNAIDDDCDGRVDEDFGLDEPCVEGEGACEAGGRRVCDGAGGVTCSAVAGQPGDETCNNRDDDCDGTIDEGPAGAPITRACYDGPMQQIGVGICDDGIQTCRDGAFGSCQGAQGPRNEACNSTDDDCDGVIDEGVADCDCEPGEMRACYSGDPAEIGVGVCVGGTQACVEQGGNRTFGPCVGEVLPGDELCDGDDDDCDGAVDEGSFGGCSAGVGVCTRPGEEICVDARLMCDAQPGPMGVEACNRLDDDCDGTADEGTFGACTRGVGECARGGDERCINGEEVCDAVPAEQSDEVCNGLDDDCDGRPDENASSLCVNPPGARSTCASGACDLTCDPGLIDANGAREDGCEVGCARSEAIQISGEAPAGAFERTSIAIATTGAGSRAVAYVGAPPVVQVFVDGQTVPVAFDLERIDGIDLARDDGGLALIAWHDAGEVVTSQVVAIVTERGGVRPGVPVAFESDGVPMLVHDGDRGIADDAVVMVWASRGRGGVLRVQALPRGGPLDANRARDLDGFGAGWLGVPELMPIEHGGQVSLIGLAREGDTLSVRTGVVDAEQIRDAVIETAFERPQLAAAAGEREVLAIVGDGRAVAVAFDPDALDRPVPVDLPVELAPGALIAYEGGYVVAGVSGGEVVYTPIVVDERQLVVGALALPGPGATVVGDPRRPRIAWIDEARQVWSLDLECTLAP